MPRHPLKVALQISVGGLCRLNHHELSFAISDFNERIGLLPSAEIRCRTTGGHCPTSRYRSGPLSDLANWQRARQRRTKIFVLR